MTLPTDAELTALANDYAAAIHKRASRYISAPPLKPLTVQSISQFPEELGNLVRDIGGGGITGRLGGWIVKKVARVPKDNIAFVSPLLPKNIFYVPEAVEKKRDKLEEILFHETVHTFNYSENPRNSEEMDQRREAVKNPHSTPLSEGAAEYLTLDHVGSYTYEDMEEMHRLLGILVKSTNGRRVGAKAELLDIIAKQGFGKLLPYVSGSRFYADVHKELGIGEVYDLAFAPYENDILKASEDEVLNPQRFINRRRREGRAPAPGLHRTDKEYIQKQLFTPIDHSGAQGYSAIDVLEYEHKSKEDLMFLQDHAARLMKEGLEEFDPDKLRLGQSIFAMATAQAVVKFNDPLVKERPSAVIRQLAEISEQPQVVEAAKGMIDTSIEHYRRSSARKHT